MQRMTSAGHVNRHVELLTGMAWVSMAVRERGMQVAQTDALQQSTLARYLPMLGPDVTAVPNTMQPYLAGIGPTVKSRLKLQFRSQWDCSCCS
jgi:hypothetical protein